MLYDINHYIIEYLSDVFLTAWDLDKRFSRLQRWRETFTFHGAKTRGSNLRNPQGLVTSHGARPRLQCLFDIICINLSTIYVQCDQYMLFKDCPSNSLPVHASSNSQPCLSGSKNLRKWSQPGTSRRVDQTDQTPWNSNDVGQKFHQRPVVKMSHEKNHTRSSKMNCGTRLSHQIHMFVVYHFVGISLIYI